MFVSLIDTKRVSCETALSWMPQSSAHWYYVNSDSGNGLVPSGAKPLPEPVLNQIYVTMPQIIKPVWADKT